nr:NAD(+) diphosphatase [Alteromonas oceanisediminis]
MTQTSPLDTQASYFWLIITQDRFMCSEEKQPLLHTSWQHLKPLHEYGEHVVQIEILKGIAVYMIDLRHERIASNDAWLSDTIGMRGALMSASPEEFSVIAKAWQYALFIRTHRFCGQCGDTMQRVSWEMAMQCHRCKHRCYPRVSPCIIVSIYRQGEILLAMGSRHKDTGMYSTLAGFVESGESLESAVHREVKEEVGVRVKNLRYFGSQPWPFPHSLMVGFIAEWAGDEISIDDDEICAADWFTPSNLPTTPPTLSIAGQLIQETLRLLSQ